MHYRSWNFFESHFNLQNKPHKNKMSLFIFPILKSNYLERVCYYFKQSLKIVLNRPELACSTIPKIVAGFRLKMGSFQLKRALSGRLKREIIMKVGNCSSNSISNNFSVRSYEK